MRSIIVTLVAVLLAATTSLSVAAPAFDKVTPEKTLVVVRVKNLPELETKIKAHPAYALWMEPSVQQFFAKPLGKLNEEIQKAEGKTGVKLADIWSVLRGEAALSVGVDEAGDNAEVMILANVADQGPKAMDIAGALLKAIGQNDPAAAPKLVEQTIEGFKFISVHEPNADAAAEPSFTYGVANDVFVLGRPLVAVQRQISFLKAPPAQSLAASPAYQAAVAKVSADSDAVIFANVGEIISLIQREKADPEFAQRVNALGLNGLTTAALSIDLGKDYDTSRAFFGITGTPTGIVKILTPQAGPLYTGAEVPADVSGFFTARLNPAAIYDEVERTLNAIDPMYMAGFNEKLNEAAQKSGQPFNLRNDILGVFGPRIAFYNRFEKPYNPVTSQQTVLMIDIASKAAFQAALDKIQKIDPRTLTVFKPRDYMGYQIYVMNPAALGMPEGTGVQMPLPAFVATEKALLFSPRVENLEAHIRRLSAAGQSLQDRQDFQDLLKQLPADGRVMLQFGDGRAQVEYFLTLLKEGHFDLLLDKLKQDPDTAEFLNLFDLKLLPDPAVVIKYINPSASCAIVQPDGLMIISKASSKIAAPAK